MINLTPVVGIFKTVKFWIIAGVLVASHSFAFYKGRESVLQKQTNAVVAAAKEDQKRLAKSYAKDLKRVERRAEEAAELKEKSTRIVEEARDVIESNPLPSDCNIPSDEQRLWNDVAALSRRSKGS